MSRFRVPAVARTALLALPIALFAACHAPRQAVTGAAARVAGEPAEVAQLRAATRSFQVLDSAVAAGYPRTVADCIVHEHHGAMGYHHVNRAYLDRTLDPVKPEILLYERTPDGTYRLNGAEFILPYRFWPRDTVAPVFMGQVLRREDNLKYWYLHVWAWRENPDGVFADFHPAVQCAPGTAKVYHPTEGAGDR